jgi:SAM-dependent methyltransferase
VLTVAFDRLDVRPGSRVLDLGCGGGRHAFEAWRRGATVVALDGSRRELRDVQHLVRAMADAGEVRHPVPGGVTNADALALPFPSGVFDVVIAAEVLEHVGRDTAALAELVRVTRPGGRIVVTVPAPGPERVCWALDRRYHEQPGGHVRIYRRHELEAKLAAAGVRPVGTHRAHALHSPYWWLRCATGVDRPEQVGAARRYHDFLVWQLTTRPRFVDAVEDLLNPILGKSLVVYADKPADARPAEPRPVSGAERRR